MEKLEIFNENDKPDSKTKKDIVDFLFKHLDEFGDPWSDIEKAVDFSLKEYHSFGGFIIVAYDTSQIIGAVVVNQTGMKGYIPENILVYIATHREKRGQGLGKRLMKETIDRANGDIALHVEPDNPARFLYEKVGFTSKYKEMRFKHKSEKVN